MAAHAKQCDSPPDLFLAHPTEQDTRAALDAIAQSASLEELVKAGRLAATRFTGSEPQDKVHKIWDDFEHTFEKGGYAYGMRTMHMKARGYGRQCGDLRQHFPAHHGGHSYMIVPECVAAAMNARARELIGLATRG